MAAVAQNLHQVMPKQHRSRARRDALLAHGADILNRCDLDEVSIAEITGGLGYSTGSFYSYFRDKSAFFVAVQLWVAEEQDRIIAATLAPRDMAARGIDDRLSVCVDYVIGYFRAHTGLVRSALRYERRIPEGWAPNRAATQRIVAAATTGLDPAESARLETALQLAFGMLVNALLHDPGPLHLDDPSIGPSIKAALRPYLLAQDTTQ